MEGQRKFQVVVHISPSSTDHYVVYGSDTDSVDDIRERMELRYPHLRNRVGFRIEIKEAEHYG